MSKFKNADKPEPVPDYYREHALHSQLEPNRNCSSCYSVKKSNAEKVNGLHSGTKFDSVKEGQNTIEFHEHPETHELVLIRSWFVPDGEDDVSQEFEVMAVYPPVACALAKENKDYMRDGRHFLAK